MDDDNTESERHREAAPNEQYSDEDFLQAIKNGHKGTSDIAEAVGCKRRTADYRLRQLREQEKVTAEKIGRTLVWTLPD
ncbi:transcriptional regulator [Salarchaeum sp. III]|uniref:transcriptional regulator n=1 Tax=Salarchaeum sp. III TaxID=3107927 RepID=UPI002ED8E13A